MKAPPPNAEPAPAASAGVDSAPQLSPEAAHRYNGLLSVVLGYASHLQQRPDCAPEAKEALQHICEAAQKGRRLTADLLTGTHDEGWVEEAVDNAPLQSGRALADWPAQCIWVVDDDAVFCEMCQQVLTAAGHTVQQIDSMHGIQAAWEDPAMAPPQLLIIDFSMPDGNGLECCTWLRDHGATVPVILVSGFSAQHPDIRAALQSRNVFFLQKPFPVPELEDLIAVALGAQLLERGCV